MGNVVSCRITGQAMPGWVPEEVRLYLDHVEGGLTIRSLARDTGVHASTILRKVRKTESRRDDPLVDKVLIHLGRIRRGGGAAHGTNAERLPQMRDTPIDDQTLERDARRILRALMQEGAVLAVVPEVETAVVVVETEDGRPRQSATLARRVAEAMALQNWIACAPGKKVSRYHITSQGRAALREMLARAESARAAEATGAIPGAGGGRQTGCKPGRRRRLRPVGADSPIQVLARRRDKSGQPYLTPDLVRAGERLRMDFELVQLAGLPGSNWSGIMAGQGVRAAGGDGGAEDARRLDARRRLEAAMRFLGPELGEVALMTCCQQQGMEQVEKEMAMPARAGKYVLRIALNMLSRHYQEQAGDDDDLIY